MRTLLVSLAILLGGAAAAGATTALLTSGLLATGDRTLTHATCTLQPASGDTYVNEASKTTNYSFNTSLSTAAATGGRQRALLQFNLASCGANVDNASVDSATLTLNVTSASGGTRTLKAYRVTAAWTASSTNWNTQPAAAATPTATFTAASTSLGAKSIDVTNDVNDFLQSAPTVRPPYAATVANYGWLVTDEGATTGVVSYTSSEATGAAVASRPKLTIAYAY